MPPQKTPSTRRKTPFATVIDFTVANLKEAIGLVQAHDFKQVQFCSRTDKGFHAMVYPSGATFYAHYSLPRRLGVKRQPGGRIKVGEFGLHTIAQAHGAYLKVRRMAWDGVDPKQRPDEVMTYAQFHVEHYRVQCLSRQKKTLKTDIQRHDRWIAPALGRLRINEITATHIHQLSIAMQDSGLAAATVRNVIGQVSSNLNLAVELGVLEKNPAKGIRLPKVHNQRTETLTREQVSAFLSTASIRPERMACCMLSLLALTGARLGEATNARWQDMDLARGRWTLPTQKSGKPGVIYLSQAAISVLQEVHALRRSDQVFAGHKGNERLSRPIRLFKRILTQAGIPHRFRIHDLRHAWCSGLIEAGVPIEIVSHGARHSSPVVTRRYIHPHAQVLTDANERYARLVVGNEMRAEIAA